MAGSFLDMRLHARHAGTSDTGVEVTPEKAVGRRIAEALGENMGVLLPTVQQLMAEAWEEGGRAATGTYYTGYPSRNPYKQ